MWCPLRTKGEIEQWVVDEQCAQLVLVRLVAVQQPAQLGDVKRRLRSLRRQQTSGAATVLGRFRASGNLQADRHGDGWLRWAIWRDTQRFRRTLLPLRRRFCGMFRLCATAGVLAGYEQRTWLVCQRCRVQT